MSGGLNLFIDVGTFEMKRMKTSKNQIHQRAFSKNDPQRKLMTFFFKRKGFLVLSEGLRKAKELKRIELYLSW